MTDLAAAWLEEKFLGVKAIFDEEGTVTCVLEYDSKGLRYDK